jgi:acetylornithine/N-succinyldiaminopimelate aminotransferase
MTDQLIETGKKYIMGTYSQSPVVVETGKGARVTDHNGKSYIDMVAGIAVNALGYNHPAIVNAIKEQAEKLIHISNLYWNEPEIYLAEKLCTVSHMDKAFFCNSGAEANESAIKLARKYGGDRKTIVTLQQSFHGRTLGALKATGQTKYQTSFLPLPEGFRYTPANDNDMFDQVIGSDVCGVLLEVIQGEAGVLPLEESFLKHVQAVCKEKDILFMVDEVQTGMGRTGYGFAHQAFDLQPDVITMAKAVAGGIPMGVMLAKDHAAKAFVPGDHASTFGGNPVAANTGLAVANVIFDEDFLAEVRKKGDYFKEQLSSLVDGKKVHEVRGRGLMLGIVLDDAIVPGDIVNACREKGLLVCTAGKHVLRFVPPLVLTKEDIDEAVAIVKQVLFA